MDLDFARVLLAFTALLLSLTVHEAAHAWSADILGDPTARRLGRVSLNPVVHIDPIGTLLFPLVSMLSPVPLIGWAKPVPVSPSNLHPNWQQKFMAIAAAGPASNVVLAILAAVGLRLIGFTGGSNPTTQQLYVFCRFMVGTNVALAVFNMLPVPPLDGGNVLMGLLRGRAAEIYATVRPYGFVILYALLLSGYLWEIVGPIEDAILSTLL